MEVEQFNNFIQVDILIKPQKINIYDTAINMQI